VDRQQILDAIKQRPFQPFRIHLADGKTHDVRDPRLVKLLPDAVFVATPDPRWPPPAIDTFDTAPLEAITRLEPIDSAASTTPSSP